MRKSPRGRRPVQAVGLGALLALVLTLPACRTLPQPTTPEGTFESFRGAIRAERYGNAWDLFTKDTQARYSSEEFAMLFVKTKVGPLVEYKLRTWTPSGSPGTGDGGKAVLALRHPLHPERTSRFEFVTEGKLEGSDEPRWAMRFFLVDELGMPRPDEERISRPEGWGPPPPLHAGLPEKTPDGAEGIRTDFLRFQNAMIGVRMTDKPDFPGVYARTAKWTRDHYGLVNFVTLMKRTRLGALLVLLFSEWAVDAVEPGPGDGEAALRLRHPSARGVTRTFRMFREGDRWRLRLSLGELIGIDAEEEDALLGARYKDEGPPSKEDW